MKKRVLLLIIGIILTSVSWGQLISIDVKAENDRTGICEGDTVQLIMDIRSNGDPEKVYRWEPNRDISDTTIVSPKVYPKRSTFYFVWVTDTDNNITLKDSILISVSPKPTVYAGPDDSTCVDSRYKFDDTNISLEISKTWEHNGLGSLENPETSNPTYIPADGELGPVRFIVTGTGIGYCEEIKDTVIIHYFPSPVSEILSPDTSLCSNEEFVIKSEISGSEGFDWEIYPDATEYNKGVLINVSDSSATYIPKSDESGKVKIILHAIGLGCTVTDTLTVDVSSMYIVSTNDTTICEGETIDLSVTSLPGLTYKWSTGGTRNYITIKEALATEEYIVEVWNEAGCYFTDTILVEVIPSPHLTVTLDEDEQLITVDPFDLSRYIFYVNADTLQDGISNTFNYSDYIGIYDTIYVMAYNADGCSSYGDEDYAIINDGSVEPPLEKVNAFSPNGDGINDRLMQGRKVTVMDRTSKILYEGYDGWDGTFNGKEMPQGTYFYILYDDDGKLFYKGPVTILR